jgi:methylated-DNA-protein-cysteine methyltransferase related protein
VRRRSDKPNAKQNRRATTDSAASSPDEPNIAEQIWQVIALIPRGSVATYGQVAELAGLPGGARRVGRVLSQLPRGSRIPWHRVVNASGGISLPESSGGYARQRSRLTREGVVFNTSGRIALKRFRWRP